MTLTGMELVKKGLREGWEIERISSSHYILKKGDKTVSIPVHSGKSLKPGLLNRLLKDMGLK